LEIRRTNFVACVIRETDFTNTNLAAANFADSDLPGAKFQNTNLEKANFAGARNYYIDPRENKIKQAKFSYPDAMGLLAAFDIVLE